MKFWNFSTSGDGSVLRINGYIAETSWFEDDVTPKQFASELAKAKGDLTVWINSGGGDCFAASQIFTMLKEYKGKVTVKIDGVAFSAASVIAMAGDKVQMSPTAMMMIHNPATMIFGEVQDLEDAIDMLNEVKSGIINAYVGKTGLPRDELSQMMDDTTNMSALRAVELGFADEMLYERMPLPAEGEELPSASWNSRTEVMAVASAMRKKLPLKKQQPPTGTPIDSLEKRLSLLSH